MDFKQIQELLKMVMKSDIGELAIEQQDGFKIHIKQKEENVVTVPTVTTYAPQPVAAAPAAAPVAAPTATEASAPAVADNLITIKSPMIGTFYRSPSPDKPSFANVGDEIKPGQVLCIIEAMKLFNEIEAEISGKIVKVLIDDASPVEYDQPLFLVQP